MHNPKSCLKILTLSIGILMPVGLRSQVILNRQMSDRITEYDMKVNLDTESKKIKGDIKLKWKNPSQDTVSDLQFHMYLNAFKNDKSTMMTEGAPFLTDEKDRGWVEIESMQDQEGNELTPNMHYFQPDQETGYRYLTLPQEKPLKPDDPEKDQTVLRVPLEKPVLPGDSIEVRISFTSKLPALTRRTGYAEDYYFVAQWFPKLAVYEPQGMRGAEKGGWNAHEFHRNSEFYSNHSLYKVDITLPKDFVIGSGGVELNKHENGDGTATHSIRAEDIVDFAWTASRDYLAFEDQWEHVSIKFLCHPEHAYQAERHIRAVKYALQYLNDHVGPYPWPHVTFIGPPAKGSAANGMEYTTIFTAGTIWGLPEGIRLPELVTVHEFGHSYFMGMLATNEFEEPWMDEGMNTYWENRIMDYAYGKKTSVFNLPFLNAGDVEFARLQYVMYPNPKIADSYRPAWEFPHGSYGTLIYQKTATWLNMLERMIGQETIDEIFQRYYNRWAFKHPGTQDFIDIVNEVVTEIHGDKFGESMDWYFDQFLKSDKMMDYAVVGVTVRKMKEKGGVFGDFENKEFREPDDIEDMYRSIVRMERMEEAIAPVEILVHFDNGEEVMEYWDGRERSHDLVYERPEKVVWAQIDPDMKMLMDSNILNNSYTRNPSKLVAGKYAGKFLFLVQNLMQMSSIFN
jgi:hypothetical protein